MKSRNRNVRNLTDAQIARMPFADRGERVVYWHEREPRVSLRIGSRSKTLYFKYMLNGEARRHKLGRAGTGGISMADAMAKVREMDDLIKDGLDPEAVEQQAIEDELQRQADTLEAVVTSYIDNEARPKRRSWRNTQAILEKYVVPAETRSERRLGGMPISDIKTRHLTDIIDDVAKTKPVMANRVHSAISAMFTWAVPRHDLPKHPLRGVSKPTDESGRKRERCLSDDELRAIWHAASSVFDPTINAMFRMIVLTGQRRAEVSSLQIEELDLTDNDETNGAVWTIPRERYKGKRMHMVPLTPMMISTIESTLHGRSAGRLFRYMKAGQQPNWSWYKGQLDAALKAQGHTFERWTWHDLRRTMSRWMESNRINLITIEAVLGHNIARNLSGASSHYLALDMVKEKRDALEQWNGHVRRIAGPSLKVVSA